MINTSQFVVCCDMDDTMTELLRPWLMWLNNKYDLNVKYEDIKHWSLEPYFPTLTTDQIVEPLYREDFWATVNMKDNCTKYIEGWIRDGIKFYVCTSTSYSVMKQKFTNCLFRLFPYLTKKDIIITYNKQLINCDVLIDDGTHNITGGRYVGVLIDMPHNVDFADAHFRATNWSEVDKIVRELYNVWKLNNKILRAGQ